MNTVVNNQVMNAGADDFVYPLQFDSVEAERLHRKQQLTAAFRLFGKFGFDEGVAGHITVRDPERTDHFWVNPMGVSFKQMTLSQLLLVNHEGEVVEGKGLLNGAAFTIHSQIHKARPDVMAVAHSHSLHGKAWSSLGRLLDPITQDACIFFDDHAVFEEFNGVVLDMDDGASLASALGDKKACILQNHGLLTVGDSIEAAAWLYITMERSCQAQMLAEAAGTPKHIPAEVAVKTREVNGSSIASWFSFRPLFSSIVAEQPDMFE